MSSGFECASYQSPPGMSHRLPNTDNDDCFAIVYICVCGVCICMYVYMLECAVYMCTCVYMCVHVHVGVCVIYVCILVCAVRVCTCSCVECIAGVCTCSCVWCIHMIARSTSECEDSSHNLGEILFHLSHSQRNGDTWKINSSSEAPASRWLSKMGAA